MKKQINQKGITLIALVITIIVLLILAGVSIAMLTGENGILTQAQKAKEKTEEAEKDEMKDIAILDEMIDGKGTYIEEVTDKNPGVLELKDGTYVINSIEDLVAFASSVNKGTTYEGQIVKLGLSLDFNSSKSYVNPFRTDYEKYGYNGKLKKLLTSGDGFIPIGTNTNALGYEGKSFHGIFDGNGKIIKNLYINQKIEDNQNDLVSGLFGYNYGTIKKLGIENCNNNGSLTTCGINTCMVGGIAGRNCKDIEECFVSGNVACVCNAKSRSGGICATSNSNTNIINCYNLASINCTSGEQANVAGGIAGNTDGKLYNCFNNGRVLMITQNNDKEDLSYVGGIVGIISNGEVKNCYNLNTVEFNINSNLGKFWCGGITGQIQSSSLNHCYNKGSIHQLNLNCKSNYIGLILGLAKACTASDCSSLNFAEYVMYVHDGNSNIDNFKKFDDDSNMPNILNILGEKFKLVSNDYPVLSWQVENN